MDKNIERMITENGLEGYIRLFNENKLETFEIMKNLTDFDLKELGIDNIGHRKILLNILSKRKKQIIKKRGLIISTLVIVIVCISIISYKIRSEKEAAELSRRASESLKQSIELTEDVVRRAYERVHGEGTYQSKKDRLDNGVQPQP